MSASLASLAVSLMAALGEDERAVFPPAQAWVAVPGAKAFTFSELFDAHARSLVRLARFFVDDRDAAEDIVQEAFLRLHRQTARLDHDTNVAAYLRAIVLNLARDHNRRGLMSLRHQLPAGREVDVDVDLVERDVLRSETQRAVLDAVRRLPRRQRDCVVLRYYESMPIEEIAVTLAVSPNSVKTHLRRGLDALERTLAVGQ